MKKHIGARRPLFDLFLEPKNKYLTKEELEHSIAEEVSKILNTRFPLKENKDLPFAYGLKDFAELQASNHAHWKKIAFLCTQAIKKFEPRIQNIDVRVSKYEKQKLYLRMTGNILIQAEKYQVNFETYISDSAI